MQFVLAAALLILSTFALVSHFELGLSSWAAGYGFGAGVAAITLVRESFDLWLVRFLATLAALVMFCYFAGFFSMTPYQVDGAWYLQTGAGGSLCMFFAGFAMMPVLAALSCHKKELKHREAQAEQRLAKAGFEPISRPASIIS